jgi:hypothetical protein
VKRLETLSQRKEERGKRPREETKGEETRDPGDHDDGVDCVTRLAM